MLFLRLTSFDMFRSRPVSFSSWKIEAYGAWRTGVARSFELISREITTVLSRPFKESLVEQGLVAGQGKTHEILRGRKTNTRKGHGMEGPWWPTVPWHFCLLC